MRKVFNILLVFLVVFSIACTGTLPGGDVGGGGTTTGSGPVSGNLANFPSDFKQDLFATTEDARQSGIPELGQSEIGGFGGDVAKDKAGNRAALRHRPVILIHGHGATAISDKWGWKKVYQQLKDLGYNDSEIWAVSYLGADPMGGGNFDNPWPYSGSVDEVRAFIKKVMEYLGVDKVDVISHSLGCVMVRAAIHGYTGTGTGAGTFSASKAMPTSSFGRIIMLSGANYGFQGVGYGSSSSDEWYYGQQLYQVINTQANVSQIEYVAIRSVDDAVDKYTPPGQGYNGSTCYLQGAVANLNYNYAGGSEDKHAAIIGNMNNAGAFDMYKQYLLNPISATPVVTINPASASISTGSVEVTISVTGNPTTTEYKIDDGAWQTYSAPFTLPVNSGETKVVTARASNSLGVSPEVSATYTGVSEPVPAVTISPESQTFSSSQQVTISATNNPTSIQYRVNGGTWTPYSAPFTITETSTIEAKAANAGGESQIASVTYTKEEVPAYISASGTATEHYIAGRLDYSGYLAMGNKYGYMDAFTLYSTDNGTTWTDIQPGS